MPRKLRVEVEGGLYHVITRGNDRQDIFHSEDDHLKFLALLKKQKEKSPFYLYAFCLMTNHVHLLIERQAETVGNIMRRLLTGYSQYYNRRYRHVGHVFQGRHKAILCDSDPFLSELVRYIHLNPVRAKWVINAEDYPFSSQRAYLGLEPAGIVDIDPVLRRFGNRKEIARERFAQFVRAGAALGHQEKFYSSAAGNILGSEEFVDRTIHRLGEVERNVLRKARKQQRPFDQEALLCAVETVFGLMRSDFCGRGKNLRTVMAKEVLILTGRDAGATVTQLADLAGLDVSTTSRRCDAARIGLQSDSKLSYAHALVKEKYDERIADLQD